MLLAHMQHVLKNHIEKTNKLSDTLDMDDAEEAKDGH